MGRVPLSKSQLSKEKENLVSYGRYLPALDLKRQQLVTARARAREAIVAIEAEVAQAVGDVGAALPMLADRRVGLDGLCRLGAVRMGTQNVAGARLPRVEAVEVIRAEYGPMTRPHWVDAVADRLAAAIRLRVEARVAVERLAALDKAVARITQRVNLFDKVLIPQARDNIRRINVYLGDAERSAVVGAKLAKKKREAEAARLAAAGGGEGSGPGGGGGGWAGVAEGRGPEGGEGRGAGVGEGRGTVGGEGSGSTGDEGRGARGEEGLGARGGEGRGARGGGELWARGGEGRAGGDEKSGARDDEGRGAGGGGGRRDGAADGSGGEE